MEIIIHGDKLKITEAMSDYIKEKLKKLDKYLEDTSNVRANVMVKVKNNEQRVEITIPLKKFILRSEEIQKDFYTAVDKTIDKLERQIIKNKTKLEARQNKTSYGFNLKEIEVKEEEANKIVRRKTVEVKPMDEEEAIIQMELLGHEFFMYKDSNSNKYAVVYKRNDGNYGILESE